MPTITISIPDKMKQELDKHPEVNWPEVLRQGFQKRVDALKKMKQQGLL